MSFDSPVPVPDAAKVGHDDGVALTKSERREALFERLNLPLFVAAAVAVLINYLHGIGN